MRKTFVPVWIALMTWCAMSLPALSSESYCGRLLYMPGSFELLHRNMNIWFDEDTRDPKNLTEYLNTHVKQALSCYCIVGSLKPIVVQGHKNRYLFTEVSSLTTCLGKVIR
jgi:hypothetical protein